MTREEMTRREFVRSTSAAAAGAVTGVLIGGTTATPAKAGENTGKILNHHPQMSYRRLGKTNLMISEIGLGGHWRAPWRDTGGGWWWGKFVNEEVPEEVRKNRTEVVSKAIDCGMNYLDITGPEECLCYGAALKGRRDKMIVGADDYKLSPRRNEYCNTKSQIHNVEECLRRCGTDHLDLWRVQAKMDGTNTDADMDAVLEAFGLLKKAGKVLHFGVSSHSRPWAQHVIEKYDAVEVFIFPCTAQTKQKDSRPTKDHVEEVVMKYGPDQQSVFEALIKRDVGLITIKPFCGGSLFASENKAKVGAGSPEEHALAQLTLQCILNLHGAVTCVIPGLSTIHEVENAARASHLRQQAMSPADSQWLARMTEQRWSRLPQEYAWLHDWQAV